VIDNINKLCYSDKLFVKISHKEEKMYKWNFVKKAWLIIIVMVAVLDIFHITEKVDNVNIMTYWISAGIVCMCIILLFWFALKSYKTTMQYTQLADGKIYKILSKSCVYNDEQQSDCIFVYTIGEIHGRDMDHEKITDIALVSSTELLQGLNTGDYFIKRSDEELTIIVIDKFYS